MSVFNRKEPETDLKPLENALSELRGRVDGLFNQLGDYAALAAKVDALHTNWESERLALAELYDKAYHMLQRHAKRTRDAEALQVVEPQEVTEPSRLDLVSERVLNRRRGNGAVSPVTPR